MSEMVERVAEALRAKEMRLPGAGGLRGTLTLAPAQARELARAAIEAVQPEFRRCYDAGYRDRQVAEEYLYTAAWAEIAGKTPP